jgi:PAS domain S-box-containing protein
MALDLRTLTFALGISYAIQAITLYVLSYAIKKYKGVHEWTFGSIFLAIGFVFMFFRTYIPIEKIVIFLSNLSHLSGFIYFYIGTVKFLSIKRNDTKPLFLYGLLFVVLISFFTFIDYNLNIRAIIYSIGIGLLSFLNGYFMSKYGKKNIRNTSVFISLIFNFFGIFLFFRALYLLFIDPMQSFFAPGFMQLLTFIIAISMGLLWTFGLIIAVNQKLNSELIESRNQFELIFDTIPDAVTISEIENGQFLNTNKGFSQLLGFTKKELEGNTSYTINLWKNQEDRKNVIHEIIERGSCINQEFIFRRKDKSEFTALVSATSITVNESDCMLFVIHDISDLKQKENVIAHKNQQLEIVNAEKDKFFSILAHDLRGPFGSLINLSEVLADKSYNFSKEQMNELASTLNKTAESTYELLEDLLQWSGIHRGVKSFQPQKMTFANLMSHTLTTLENSAINKHIRLINGISDNTIIHADPYMFQSILRNLIINAIKFTKEGGDVSFYLVENDDLQQVFSVIDNGIGMKATILESIFRMNDKINRLGTNGEPSSGFGLLLCKEFVEKHGGEIWAESEEGKGSNFFFSLKKII